LSPLPSVAVCRPVRRRRSAVVAALLLAFVVVACGGDEPDAAASDAAGATGDPATVAVVGRDDLTWDTETLSATSGTITVELTCEPAVNHNLVIDERDEMVAECAPGETVVGTIDLDPGTYTYVCTVPGHERTMRGTLTVD
jgi:plastocyanin